MRRTPNIPGGSDEIIVRFDWSEVNFSGPKQRCAQGELD
jgi:hypothetical protein